MLTQTGGHLIYHRKSNIFFLFIKHHIGDIKLVSVDDNPDILLCSVFGNINNIPKIKAGCKIFFTGENIDIRPPYNNDEILCTLFDLVIGFKHTDASKKRIRFPLWLCQYNYYDYDQNNNILNHIQTSYIRNLQNKTHSANIVARHDINGQRTVIYNELSKYCDILSPGLFKNNRPEIGPTKKDKIKYISQGIFSICPENSKGEGYCTEKVFQALEAGTIPIYWGESNPEPLIINMNKYCFCDIENLNHFKHQIAHVYNNKQEYIDGPVFKEDAHVHIKNFYDSFSNSLKIILQKINQ